MFYCFRRLSLVALIIFTSRLDVQVLGVITVNVTVVILVCSTSPFRLKSRMAMEIFNEATIMLCCYHMILFSEFVLDSDTRYLAGFSMIFFTCLNLTGNVLVLIATVSK
jgi:hypothetical protein